MKKFVLFIFLAALLMQGSFLFAQQNTASYQESDFYYYNFTIEKIYTYRLGYMVVYRNSSNRIVRTYIPLEWFNDIGAKGEMVSLGTGSEWPSMVVYYKNGEFSHVRLRVRRYRGHETWGVVPLNINIDELFQGIEEVHLDF